MRDRPHYRDHGHAMPLEEAQGLLLPPSRIGESSLCDVLENLLNVYKISRRTTIYARYFKQFLRMKITQIYYFNFFQIF